MTVQPFGEFRWNEWLRQWSTPHTVDMAGTVATRMLNLTRVIMRSIVDDSGGVLNWVKRGSITCIILNSRQHMEALFGDNRQGKGIKHINSAFQALNKLLDVLDRDGLSDIQRRQTKKGGKWWFMLSQRSLIWSDYLNTHKTKKRKRQSEEAGNVQSAAEDVVNVQSAADGAIEVQSAAEETGKIQRTAEDSNLQSAEGCAREIHRADRFEVFLHNLRRIDDQIADIEEGMMLRNTIGDDDRCDACIYDTSLCPVTILGLECAGEYTFSQYKDAYRRSSLSNHPDKGGSKDSMQTINAAYKHVKAMCASNTPRKLMCTGFYIVS
jgi:hypothetical protein